MGRKHLFRFHSFSHATLTDEGVDRQVGGEREVQLLGGSENMKSESEQQKRWTEHTKLRMQTWYGIITGKNP